MNKKGCIGCLNFFVVSIIIGMITAIIVLYIPVSASYCTESKYIKGYCDFVEINDRYAVLNRQYFGRSGIFVMLGIVETKPVYLFDKREKKIIKKGEIGWWVNSSDLEISDNELYFKNNYGGFIFSTYYTPSLKKPWFLNNSVVLNKMGINNSKNYSLVPPYDEENICGIFQINKLEIISERLRIFDEICSTNIFGEVDSICAIGIKKNMKIKTYM